MQQSTILTARRSRTRVGKQRKNEDSSMQIVVFMEARKKWRARDQRPLEDASNYETNQLHDWTHERKKRSMVAGVLIKSFIAGTDLGVE